MEKTEHGLRKEDGNAMVFSAGCIILIILFMALMIDMSLYYGSYRRLRAVAEFSDEEVKQMLPYYANVDNYVDSFNSSLNETLTYLGYSQDNLVSSQIYRRRGKVGNWVISVTIDLELKDTYHCLMLSMVGITELPLHFKKTTTQTINTEEPFIEGMPFEIWGD